MGESAKSKRRIPPWVRTWVAPLFVVSVVLHGLLLLTPVPPPPPPEEVEPEEDEFVDLLNIQSLTPPEPEVPEPPPPTQAPPPPAQTIPSNQPALAQPEAAPPPPEQTLAEAPLPPDPTTPEAPTPDAPAAFVADEAAAIFSRLTRGTGESDFDATATSFPYAAYSIRQGIQEWSSQEQACFFTEISAETFTTLPTVASLRYLTRNVQFIATQDIPRTFPAPTYQINSIDGGYCNRPLFEVLRDGTPYLFISVAGVGAGAPGQQATGLVIIWTSDPRLG